MPNSIVLLDEELMLSPADSKTNVFFDFRVDAPLSHLYIDLSYEPKYFYDMDKAMGMILDSVKRYSLDMKTDMYGPLENLLPLPNLVTFSIDMNGSYRGAAHRHANGQHIEIAEKSASVGFLPGRIEPGTWRAAVNVCVVLTETCTYKLRITGIRGSVEDSLP